jgi:hypothetical protein
MSDDIHPPNHNYNSIFETIVRDSSSPKLDEMASYFLYKRAKREWATRYFERFKRKPDEPALIEYVESYTTTRLDGIVREGKGIVATYAESVIEEVTPQILKAALSERSFLRDASVAFVGAAIYTVILIAISLILAFADIDVYSIFHRVLHFRGDQFPAASTPSTGAKQDAPARN